MVNIQLHNPPSSVKDNLLLCPTQCDKWYYTVLGSGCTLCTIDSELLINVGRNIKETGQDKGGEIRSSSSLDIQLAELLGIRWHLWTLGWPHPEHLTCAKYLQCSIDFLWTCFIQVGSHQYPPDLCSQYTTKSHLAVFIIYNHWQIRSITSQVFSFHLITFLERTEMVTNYKCCKMLLY